MILSEAVEEAAKVKIAGLKVRDERIKQAVATEIIDREPGATTPRSRRWRGDRVWPIPQEDD